MYSSTGYSGTGSNKLAFNVFRIVTATPKPILVALVKANTDCYVGKGFRLADTNLLIIVILCRTAIPKLYLWYAVRSKFFGCQARILPS